MINLLQIAIDDFLMLDVTHKAADALNLVRRLRPARIIVYEDTQATRQYYLFAPDVLLPLLAKAQAKAALSETLTLRGQEKLPCLDAYTDAETAPFQCLVMDNACIVGLYDASLPLGSSMQRSNPQLIAPGPSNQYALQADFPETVVLHHTNSLLISLSQDLSIAHTVPVTVTFDAPIDIIVRPRKGFSVVGESEQQIVLTKTTMSKSVQIKLQADACGPGCIDVFCFQHGQSLGMLTLTPLVVEKLQSGDEFYEEVSIRLPVQIHQVAQPDLSLIILETEKSGQTELAFRLTAVNPDLELNLKSFEKVLLRMDPFKYFRDFYSDIEGLALRTEEDHVIAIRKLALKGARLFEDLLPQELRLQLWRLREQIKTVQILSEEPWIPWELLQLQGNESGRIIEGDFLCACFALTRWLPGIPRRPELWLQKWALVAPQDSGLPNAQAEREWLLNLHTPTRQITQIPARFDSFTEALAEGKYDVWHFIGHGHFPVADPNRASIRLEQGVDFTAGEIAGRVNNCGMSHPWVFLNACQTGHTGLALTGASGWAQRFIRAGAAGFIGSLWAVDDVAARCFAEHIYTKLLAGEMVGEAVRSARAALRNIHGTTWLAYTVFADPLARLVS